jgi:hypothetical protein
MFIKFENIFWNKEWIASKTYDEFFNHEKHHGLSKEKMMELYETCTGKKSEVTEEPHEESDFGSNGLSELNG